MNINLDPNCERLVIVGSWNPKIFTPPWICNGRFTDSEEVDVQVVMQGSEFSHRFIFDDISLSVSDTKLILRSTTMTHVILKRIEDVAKKILNELPHTPLRAVGINYMFKVDDIGDSLRDIFTFDDDPKFSDEGFLIKKSRIERAINTDEGDEINLFQTLINPDTAEFSFNFNINTKSAESAINFIENRFDKSIILMNKITAVYGIEPIYPT